MTDDTKLKWLRVRLTGWAKSAFQRLPEVTHGTFQEAVKAFRERFELESKKAIPGVTADLHTKREMKTGPCSGMI